MRARDLSLRYKIPLRVTALVIGTAFAITASLVLREREQLKQDVLHGAESLGRVLASTLAAPLAHDDVWRAFEIVNSPLQRAGDERERSAEFLVVLDERRRVFVSTRPDRFPVLSDPLALDEGLALVARAIAAANGAPVAAEPREGGRLYMIVPIVSEDGALRGTLVMAYSKGMFWPRFVSLLERAGLVTLAVLAVLLPVSWYWGHRVGVPLIELAGAMGQLGSRPPQEVRLRPYPARDEIGRLGAAFERLLAELREKEALKQEMLRTERLAAIGRLTAGVAHEINNPLGGMLNALSTFRRHGGSDPVAARTVSLLERGLRQVQETVGALLVEARPESRPLTPRDAEDIRTLLLPDLHRKSAQLAWDNGLRGTLELPSTLVRQILMNLLLNAVQAVAPHGCVACRLSCPDERLRIEVRNDGRHIPPERLEHLFEPFAGAGANGHGLGLWVTYQIVRQLDGTIGATSRPGETLFDVMLPVRRETAAGEAPGRRTATG